jgi:23S rRNA pseudouridine1911/1915/1917 synthase
MDIKIIYEDNDVLVVDKPAGVVVFCEASAEALAKADPQTYLIDELIKQKPELKTVGEAPRYGIVHRLDKDTSGVLLVAKTTEGLIFLQKQFKNREVAKKYVCLVEGTMESDSGTIETLIARAKGDPRKQRAYSALNAPKSAREAITEYKVLEKFRDYTFLEVEIKTGRRHQIRCHLSYLKHPIAGDKMYSFKNSKTPEGLTRQFLHAQKLKIQLPNGKTQEFISDLPEDLKQVKNNLAKE